MRKLLLLFSLIALFGLGTMNAEKKTVYFNTADGIAAATADGWEIVNCKTDAMYLQFMGGTVLNNDGSIASPELTKLKSLSVNYKGSDFEMQYFNGSSWVKFASDKGYASALKDYEFTLPDEVTSGTTRVRIWVASGGSKVVSSITYDTDDSSSELENPGLKWYDGNDQDITGTTYTVDLAKLPEYLPYPMTDNGAVVSVTSSDPEVAEYANYKLTIKGAGTTVLTATCPAQDGYSAGEAEFTLVVTDAEAPKKPADIKWTLNGEDVSSATFTYPTISGLAFVNPNKLDVSLSSSNTEVATAMTFMGDVMVVAKGIGTATITASFEGNDEYEAADAVLEVTITEKELMPADLCWYDAFTDLPVTEPITVQLGEDSYNLPYAMNGSGAQNTNVTSNPDVADYANGVYTVKSAGTTVFTATCPAVGDYAAGEASFTLVVEGQQELPTHNLKWYDEADQDITGTTYTVTLGSLPQYLPYPMNETGAKITVTSSDPEVAEFVGNKLQINGAGTTVLTATCAATAGHAESEASFTLVVNEQPVVGGPEVKTYDFTYEVDKPIMPADWTCYTPMGNYGSPLLPKDCFFGIVNSVDESVKGLQFSRNGSGVMSAEFTDVTSIKLFGWGNSKYTTWYNYFLNVYYSVDGGNEWLSFGMPREDVSFVNSGINEAEPGRAYFMPNVYYPNSKAPIQEMTFDVPADAQSGNIMIKIERKTDCNVVLSRVEVTIGGESPVVPELKPANIKWVDSDNAEVTEMTVTLGEEPFSLPVIVKDTDAPVTVTSSDAAVADWVDGAIVVKAAGQTVFSAVSEANDTYEAGMATFTLIVDEIPQLESPELKWFDGNDVELNGTTYTVTFGELPEYLPYVQNANGALITVVSSNPEVAEYANYVMTIKGAGTTVLTATCPEQDGYAAGEATFTLVVEAQQLVAPVVVMNNDDFTATITREGEVGKITYYYGPVADAADVAEDEWTTSDDATVTVDFKTGYVGDTYLHAYTAAPDANYIDSEVVSEPVFKLGVAAIALDGEVKVVNGTIVVPADAQIFTAAGVRVNGLNAAAGVYVVRFANGATAKVMVK